MIPTKNTDLQKAANIKIRLKRSNIDALKTDTRKLMLNNKDFESTYFEFAELPLRADIKLLSLLYLFPKIGESFTQFHILSNLPKTSFYETLKKLMSENYIEKITKKYKGRASKKIKDGVEVYTIDTYTISPSGIEYLIFAMNDYQRGLELNFLNSKIRCEQLQQEKTSANLIADGIMHKFGVYGSGITPKKKEDAMNVIHASSHHENEYEFFKKDILTDTQDVYISNVPAKKAIQLLYETQEKLKERQKKSRHVSKQHYKIQ